MSGVGGCCTRRILGAYNDPEDTKKIWVLNNDHRSEGEEGDHEERAVVIIFACCHDYRRANGCDYLCLLPRLSQGERTEKQRGMLGNYKF